MGNFGSNNDDDARRASSSAGAGLKSKQDLSWRAANLQQIREIGTGPYGTVLEATNLKLKQPCAIKIIEYRDRLDPNFLYAQRKAKQLMKLTKAKHPNIIKTYNCETIEMENSYNIKHKFAFIMDLMQENMKGLIRKRHLATAFFSEIDLLKAILEMIDALVEAKKYDIYHQNIKDENIFYNSSYQRFILADFDLADNIKSSSRTGVFSPPENRDPTFSFENYDYSKTDVYAIGVVILKLALMSEDLKFENENPTNLLSSLVTKKFPRIYLVVSKMLDKNPTNRPGLNEVLKSTQEHLCGLQGFAWYEQSIGQQYLTDNQNMIRILISNAENCRKYEDYRQAIHHYEKALSTLYQTESLRIYDRHQQSNILFHLALCQVEAREYQRSVRNALKCYKLRKNQLNGEDCWKCLGLIGKVYNSLLDYQNGLSWYLKTYDEYITVKNKDRQTEAKCLDYIANCYENLEEWENAFELYVAIMQILKEEFGEASSHYIRQYKNLARISRKLGKIDAAREFEKKTKEKENANANGN